MIVFGFGIGIMLFLVAFSVYLFNSVSVWLFLCGGLFVYYFVLHADILRYLVDLLFGLLIACVFC